MRKRSIRRGNHVHSFESKYVGAGLRRRVCKTCGEISITSVPPTSLRSEVPAAEHGLFAGSSVTVQLADFVEPVVARPRFGERRIRR